MAAELCRAGGKCARSKFVDVFLVCVQASNPRLCSSLLSGSLFAGLNLTSHVDIQFFNAIKTVDSYTAKTAQRSAGMERIVDSVYSLQSAAWFSDSVTSHERRQVASVTACI